MLLARVDGRHQLKQPDRTARGPMSPHRRWQGNRQQGGQQRKAPHASVVKASSCGPPRCAALAGSIACGAGLGRGGQLRTPLFPLVECRRRRKRPNGDCTRILHQGGRGVSAARGDPSVGGGWGSGGSGGPQAWRRQNWQGGHASGHSMGCMWRCGSYRWRRLQKGGRPSTKLRTQDARVASRQGMSKVRREPLSSPQGNAGALLQYFV